MTPSRVIIRYSAKVSQSEPCSPFLCYSEYEWVQLTFIVQVDSGGSGEGGGVERNDEKKEEQLGEQIYSALDVALTEAQKQNE